MIDTSPAALYGKGVFTTMRIAQGKPWLWEKHWRRINDHAAAIGIDLSAYAEADVAARLSREIASADIVSGRARLTFYDEGPSPLWSPDNGEEGGKTALSLIIAEAKPVTGHLRLTVSPYPVNSLSPIAGLKTCNYLEPLLAIREAKNKGFDEAVRLNQRARIASASMANLFWLKDENLFTPGLSNGCLAGTTRAFVMENIEVKEVDAGIGELETADAIFLTSAGVRVTAVSEFDGRPLPATRHPILDLVPK